MARNLLNIPASDDEGGIIKITTWKNDSRYVMSATSGTSGRNEFLGNVGITFIKEKSNSDSYIFVTGMIPGLGMPNYPQIGCMCTIDDLYVGYGDTNGPRTGAGGGGMHYCGPDKSNEGNLGLVHKSFKEWNIAAGTHTLTAGWNSNSNVRPFIILNPNSADQNRFHQTASHICIYEISKTA